MGADPGAPDEGFGPAFDRLLLPDEKVAWRGRPSPRAAIRGRVVANVAVSLPFLALVAFMGVRAGWGPQSAIYAVLFGLGLWQLSRPWRFLREAEHTVYAVTDQRVLLATFGRKLELRSLAPGQIRDVLLKRFADGKGHVYLATSRAGRLQVRYDRVGYFDGFWGVDDPLAAANAVRALQATYPG